MSIVEKLGITPGPWEAEGPGFVGPKDSPIVECSGTSEDCFLIAAAPEMLEALIDLTIHIEETYYMRESDRKKDYPLDCMKAIQSATGKTWEEIKELL